MSPFAVNFDVICLVFLIYIPAKATALTREGALA